MSTLPPSPGPGTSTTTLVATAARLRRLWWLYLLGAAGQVVFGVLLLAWPAATATVVGVLAGLALLWVGAACVVDGFLLRPAALWWAYLARGGVTLVFGILLVAWPGRTGLVLAVLVGLFLLLAGLSELVGCLLLPTAEHRVFSVLVGLFAVVTGIYAMAEPARSLGLFAFVLGVFLVANGVIDFFGAWSMRRLGRDAVLLTSVETVG